MPFGRCPVCGAMYHLNVGLPLDEWYRQHWPQLRVGDEVPSLCLRCWVNLRPGHRVTVRGFTYFQPNERWCLHQVSDSREAGAGQFAFRLGERPPGRFQGRTGRLDLAVQAADALGGLSLLYLGRADLPPDLA